MRDHLTSTETGVFRDVIDKTIVGLRNTINAWASDLRPALNIEEQEVDEEEVEETKIESTFEYVEATFHNSYLDEDIEETQAKGEAKRVLRKVIGIAKLALPALTREIEKCKE